MGLAIAFLSITGAAALFRIEMDEWLFPNLHTVTPQGPKKSLDQMANELRSIHADKRHFEVSLPDNNHGTWNFRFIPDQQHKVFPVLWEVFVNPYTLEIAGIGLKLFYTLLALSSGFLAVSGFVVYLHRTNKKNTHSHADELVNQQILTYTVCLLGFCTVIAILSLNFGIGVPTVLVSVTFYVGLLFFLIKSIVSFFYKKTRVKTNV